MSFYTLLNTVISEDAQNWKPQKLLAAMGALNRILYQVTTDNGLVEVKKLEGNERLIEYARDAFKRIEGRYTLRMASTYLVGFLERFWGVLTSRRTLGRIRECFERWGLFTVGPIAYTARPLTPALDPERYNPEIPQENQTLATALPTEYRDINIQAVLTAYQRLRLIYEGAIKDFEYLGKEIPEVPEHNGWFANQLFTYFKRTHFKLDRDTWDTLDHERIDYETKQELYEAEQADKTAWLTERLRSAKEYLEELTHEPTSDWVTNAMGVVSQEISQLTKLANYYDSINYTETPITEENEERVIDKKLDKEMPLESVNDFETYILDQFPGTHYSVASWMSLELSAILINDDKKKYLSRKTIKKHYFDRIDALNDQLRLEEEIKNAVNTHVLVIDDSKDSFVEPEATPVEDHFPVEEFDSEPSDRELKHQSPKLTQEEGERADGFVERYFVKHDGINPGTYDFSDKSKAWLTGWIEACDRIKQEAKLYPVDKQLEDSEPRPEPTVIQPEPKIQRTVTPKSGQAFTLEAEMKRPHTPDPNNPNPMAATMSGLTSKFMRAQNNPSVPVVEHKTRPSGPKQPPDAEPYADVISKLEGVNFPEGTPPFEVTDKGKVVGLWDPQQKKLINGNEPKQQGSPNIVSPESHNIPDDVVKKLTRTTYPPGTRFFEVTDKGTVLGTWDPSTKTPHPPGWRPEKVEIKYVPKQKSKVHQFKPTGKIKTKKGKGF